MLEEEKKKSLGFEFLWVTILEWSAIMQGQRKQSEFALSTWYCWNAFWEQQRRLREMWNTALHRKNSILQRVEQIRSDGVREV